MDKIQAALDGEPFALGLFMKDLTAALISLFSSPLCAYRATRMYVNLSCVVSAGILSLWSKIENFSLNFFLKSFYRCSMYI